MSPSIQAQHHPLRTVPRMAFPLDAIGADGTGTQYLAQPGVLTRLASLERVELTGLVLPDGRTVALDLERAPLDVSGMHLFVDGTERSIGPSDPSLSMWSGRVVGEPDSRVYLGFSQLGCRGWIRSGALDLNLVTSRADLRAGLPPRCLLAERRLLSADPTQEQFACGTFSPVVVSPPQEELSGFHDELTCKLALTSDPEFTDLLGSVQAAENYAIQLFGFVSEIYLHDISVRLSIVHLEVFSSTATDPWNTAPWQNAQTIINSIALAWVSCPSTVCSLPGDADAALLLCGAGFSDYYGLANGLDVLCAPMHPAQSIAVFKVDGSVETENFDFLPDDTNMDLCVAAHELGHLFGAIHTHAFCPPVDKCSGQTSETCFTGLAVCTTGTLMSVCWKCLDQGADAIELEFHSNNQAQMRDGASCLPVSTTQYVGGNHPNFATIQGAIDDASDGWTILCGPDTYTERINFNGKDIVVKSTDGPATTILDANENGVAVRFTNSEPITATIDGFTIREGKSANGGGIHIVTPADATIRGNIITGNTMQNGSDYLDLHGGGAVYAEYNPNAGTGKSTVYILDNVITHNHSANLGGAIVIQTTDDSRIEGNLIANNTAGGQAGAIKIGTVSHYTLFNNTITANTSDDWCGGLFATPASAEARNNIIFGNVGLGATSVNWQDGWFVVSPPSSNDYNLLGDFSIINGPAGVHDIQMNPVFFDPANEDYRLAWGSYCIDAGDPAFPADPDSSVADVGALPFDPGVFKPFQDIGYSAAGPSGLVPQLTGVGSLQEHSYFAIRLTGGLSSKPLIVYSGLDLPPFCNVNQLTLFGKPLVAVHDEPLFTNLGLTQFPLLYTPASGPLDIPVMTDTLLLDDVRMIFQAFVVESTGPTVLSGSNALRCWQLASGSACP